MAENPFAKFAPKPEAKPSGVDDLRAWAKSEAERLGVPWSIANNLIQAESSWNPAAIGPPIPGRTERAIGLAQLLPSTARDLKVDPYNAKQNITGGLTYLKQNVDRFGSYEKALAGYNWGPDYVAKKGFGAAPAGTKAYVQKIMAQENSQKPAPAKANPFAQFAAQAQPAAEGNPFAQFAAQAQPEPESQKPAPATTAAPRQTRGIDFGLMPEQFKSGVAGMQQGFYTTQAKNALEGLQILDKIDKGEPVTEMQDPLGYKQMNPTQRAAERAELEKFVPKNISKAVAYGAEQQAYAKNPLAEQFVKAANKDGMGAAWKVFQKDPLGIIQQFSVQSTPNMLPGLVGGAAGVLLRGGLPALMTGLATGSFPVEYMASIVESLQEAKVDIKNAEAVEAKLRDPKFLEEAGKKAVTRGTVIAASEAATGRLAAPITRAAGLGKNLRAAGKNLLVEPGMEMAGEATAQQAAGQGFKLGEVLAEGLGAGPQVVATTALKTAAGQRPTKEQRAERAARTPPSIAERVEPTVGQPRAPAPERGGRVEPTLAPDTTLLRPTTPAGPNVEEQISGIMATLPVTREEAAQIVTARNARKSEEAAALYPPVLQPVPTGTATEERLLDIYNQYIEAGFPPDQAETLARERLIQEEADDAAAQAEAGAAPTPSAGETRVDQSVDTTGGVGTEMAGVPGGVPPTEGVAGAESTGVVPPTEDAGPTATGETAQPSAVEPPFASVSEFVDAVKARDPRTQTEEARKYANDNVDEITREFQRRADEERKKFEAENARLNEQIAAEDARFEAEDKAQAERIAEAESVGYRNAEAAFDTAYLYSSLDDAIEGHRENAQDTLTEQGRKSQQERDATEAAFNRRIEKLKEAKAAEDARLKAEAKTADYSVTLQDSTGRTTTLFISGDSIDAEIAAGVPEEQARENHERNAFENAIAKGEINEDAWLADTAEYDAAEKASRDNQGSPDQTPSTTGFAATGVDTRAGGEAPVTKRGRKKVVRTAEEQEKYDQERKDTSQLLTDIERQRAKALKKFKAAEEPLDEGSFANEEELQQARDHQRTYRKEAIRDLLGLSMMPQVKGRAVGKRIKADLDSLPAQEVADIRKGIEAQSSVRKKSSEAAGVIRKVNPDIVKATTLGQALQAVLKTGTPMQKFFVKRLLPLVKDVRFVVLSPEVMDSEPELIGVVGFFEEGIVAVRAASKGAPNGVNNVTVLHEALHAAAHLKLAAVITAGGLRGGNDQASVAAREIADLMARAERTYNRVTKNGARFPTEGLLRMAELVSSSRREFFTDPEEFLAYALTDDAFQAFLQDYVKPPGKAYTGLSGFVKSIGKLLGLKVQAGGPTEVNDALFQLVIATDQLLSAPVTEQMREALANRKQETKFSRGPTPPPGGPVRDEQIARGLGARSPREIQNDVNNALRGLEQSTDSEMYKRVGMLQRAREEGDILLPLKELYSKADYKARTILANAVTFDFLGRWTEGTLPSIKDTYVVVQKLLGHINALQEAGIKQVQMLDRHFKAERGLEDKINELVYTATIAEVDPANPQSLDKSPILTQMFNALTDRGKEAYRQVIGFHEDLRDYYEYLLDKNIREIPGIADEVKENLLTKIYEKFSQERKIEPYVPLVRDAGDFWLAVGTGANTQVYIYESREERAADARRIAREQYNNAAVNDLLEGGEFGEGNDLNGLRARIDVRGTLLSDLFDAIDYRVPRDNITGVGTDTAKINEQLKNDLFDLWLALLPEQAFRKQFHARKGRAGYRPDIRRNIASHITRVAPVLSRLRYGTDLRNQQERTRLLTGSREDLTPFKESVDERVNAIMSPTKRGAWDAVAGAANKLTYLTYLTGVSTSLLQPFGMFISSLPIIAANHGANPASVLKELTRVIVDLRQYGITKKLPNGEIQYVAPSLLNSKRLSPEERAAVQAMVDMNVSTQTYTGFIWDAGREETSSSRNPFIRAGGKAADVVINGLLRNTERLTREATFLTSYRVGRRNGLTHEEAILQAASDTKESLGDYDLASRPQWMRTPLGRVAFAMKMYPVVVIQQLFGSLIKSLPVLNREGKKQAVAKFAGIMMTASMLAGVYNAPFADLIIRMLAGLLGDMDDDDLPDELKDKDPVLWFKTVFMPSKLGHIKIADVPLDQVLGEGLISSILNKDFGSRIGLNDLWARDGKPAGNTQEAITAFMISYFGGPITSYALSMGKAYEDMMIGDYKRAFERVVPLAHVRNAMITDRVSKEGYTSPKGEVVPPEYVSQADLAWQAMGVSPADVAAARELSFKKTGVEQRILKERDLLIRRIKLSFDKDDLSLRDKVVSQQIPKFNANNPEYKIEPEQLIEILEAYLESKAASRVGVNLDEKTVRIFGEAVDRMESRVEDRTKK